MELDVNIAAKHFNSALEFALADVAPRALHVAPDVDLDRIAHARAANSASSLVRSLMPSLSLMAGSDEFLPINLANLVR